MNDFKPGDRVRDFEGNEYTVEDVPRTAYKIRSKGDEAMWFPSEGLSPAPPADRRVDVVVETIADNFPGGVGSFEDDLPGVARAILAALDAETDGPLVHVGYYCWRGGCEHQDGHLAAMPCKSDSVPIYVPKRWEKDMRGVMDE